MKRYLIVCLTLTFSAVFVYEWLMPALGPTAVAFSVGVAYWMGAYASRPRP